MPAARSLCFMLPHLVLSAHTLPYSQRSGEEGWGGLHCSAPGYSVTVVPDHGPFGDTLLREQNSTATGLMHHCLALAFAPPVEQRTFLLAGAQGGQ
jgi:hypothetical protein